MHCHSNGVHFHKNMKRNILFPIKEVVLCSSYSSPSHTLQRGINVQPTYNNYSSSGDNEGSEAESDAVAQDVTQSSTQALTQLAMEEGERRGSRGRRRESVFSRFNRYAGSFRVKLSKRDKKQLEEQSEERYELFVCS